jgi:transcriptional regulator with XRE-family HTH domain
VARPGSDRKSTIHESEYRAILSLLQDARHEAGLTQAEVAKKVGYTRTVISKWECGELRIDLLQLRRYCEAIGLPLLTFVERVEVELSAVPAGEPTE